MKIAIYPVNAGGTFHGLKRRCVSLAEGLVDLGHDVSIILSNKSESFHSQVSCRANIMNLEDAQDISWDIIHTQGSQILKPLEDLMQPEKRLFSYAGRTLRANVKEVFWSQGGMGAPIPNKLWVHPKRDNYVVAFQDISRYAAVKHLLSKSSLERSVVLECGISDGFRNAVRPKKKERPLVIGFFREKRKQGLKVILKALEEVSKKTSNWSISCFGFKPFPNQVEIGEVEANYVHNITEEQLINLYCNIDIFLAVEPQAGWSHTAAEAMACGCATICGWCGTALFAEHEKTALVVDTSSIKQIANAVERLINDENLRNTLSEEGKRKTQSLSWQRAAKHFISAHNRIGDFSGYKSYLDAFSRSWGKGLE